MKNGTRCKGLSAFDKSTQQVLAVCEWNVFTGGPTEVTSNISGVTPGPKDRTTKAYYHFSGKGKKLQSDATTKAQNLSHQFG